MLYAVSPEVGICGDIYQPLIALWNRIKTDPDSLSFAYANDWNRLQQEGYLVFYEVRERFNQFHAPEDLLFLTRTCVNGMIRFNKSGEFNNSLHHTRAGIQPKRLARILANWSEKLSNVTFLNEDYRVTTESATRSDFIYLDPPYFNTKSRYVEQIVYEEFLEYLAQLNRRDIKFALSFDGIRGKKDFTVALPRELYRRHVMIPSGNASFRKVIDKEKEPVLESLYLNF